MPYKSDAQRKFFHAAESRGEISSKVVNEFDQASKGKKLPEHVKSKKMSIGGAVRAHNVSERRKKFYRGGCS